MEKNLLSAFARGLLISAAWWATTETLTREKTLCRRERPKASTAGR